MSETITSDPLSVTPEKPVHDIDNEIVQFPPFPDPTDDAFEDDISENERNFYKNKFPDLNAVKYEKLHCTACDRHLGCSAKNESKMRMHPMLRTLVCHTCHTFYNSGEFDKGDDGSELYCRWCGQGGQVYCCSDCPIVFCAKCIKRNFGMPKIKEIENTDDWKCFKCNSKCLWDLRAVCWALLRYCDLRNKITYSTQDPKLKESYQKACAVDESVCCKGKINKKKEVRKSIKTEDGKRSERPAAHKAVSAISSLTASTTTTTSPNTSSLNVMTKIPPTIQVKKFASINLDDTPPKEKKAQKRPAEKDNKQGLHKIPMSVNRMVNPIAVPPQPKKIRMQSMPQHVSPIRFQNRTYQNTYMRIRPKPPQINHMPAMTVLNNFVTNTSMNNLMSNFTTDNINLSLENLTQGLDMSAVVGIGHDGFNNDVVCTPDFPLEPLCEVTEENNDDDVECITPVAPTINNNNNPPPLVPRVFNDLNADNIIQMTENDVTVNAATGGLKFRVDPQTLSSNKMYRLPDGRVFAINANPNMPGGYSATIVALTDNSTGKVLPKGSTYSAKLSAVTSSKPSSSSPTPSKRNHTPTSVYNSKHTKQSNISKVSESTPRTCDLKTPVEWYRYNLIDAVDALEYSLSRLRKLKKEATTVFLRSRTVPEIRSLHIALESLLKTSSNRFNEIRDNLNKEMKQYVRKKQSTNNVVCTSDDDDDDVEILNDLNEDPIFIDENSMESNNANERNDNVTTEVDLTGHASSDHNDSGEKSTDNAEEGTLNNLNQTDDNSTNNQEDEAIIKDNKNANADDKEENSQQDDKDDKIEGSDGQTKDNEHLEQQINGDIAQSCDKDNEQEVDEERSKENENSKDNNVNDISSEINNEKNREVQGNNTEMDFNTVSKENTSVDKIQNDKSEDKVQVVDVSDEKIQDAEMTEELIDSLLKGDTGGDDGGTPNLMDLPEDFTEP